MGRSDRILGSATKLYSGGGEDVSHSSVLASHGSLPASGPPRHERSMFQTKINTAMPIRNAPTVSTRFQVRKPVSTGYVAMRRCMPITPRMCIGKKVRLKPMISSQKCQAATLSL